MSSGITFLRDPALAFFEAKTCDTAQQPVCYRKHFHEEWSIGVIDAGETRMWCDGQNLLARRGNLVVIPPFVPHACSPAEDRGWRYKMLFVRSDWMKDAIGAAETVRPPFIQENARAALLLSRICEGLASGSGSLESESLAIRLASAALQTNRADSERPDNRHLSAPAIANLRRARDYIHDHYAANFTLADLERISGIGKFALIRSFNKEFKLPPHAYQNMLRINFAKMELNRRRPIAEIAQEAGFYDQSHFTKLFKQCVGVTPQRYSAQRA